MRETESRQCPLSVPCLSFVSHPQFVHLVYPASASRPHSKSVSPRSTTLLTLLEALLSVLLLGQAVSPLHLSPLHPLLTGAWRCSGFSNRALLDAPSTRSEARLPSGQRPAYRRRSRRLLSED